VSPLARRLGWLASSELTELGWMDGLGLSAKERGYKNRDEINVSKAGMGDIYETKIKGFFT